MYRCECCVVSEISGPLKENTGRYLSRGNFFPLLRIRSAAFAPPPSRAAASFASRSAMTRSMAFARAWKSGEEGETREGRTEAAWYDRARWPADGRCLDEQVQSQGRRSRTCEQCICCQKREGEMNEDFSEERNRLVRIKRAGSSDRHDTTMRCRRPTI